MHFTKGYFKLLAKKLFPHGYEPDTLVKAIWHGTAAMVQNNGSCTNEEAFWNDFANFYGTKAVADRPLFEEFYTVDFQEAKAYCGYTQAAFETVAMLKAEGIRVADSNLPADSAMPSTLRRDKAQIWITENALENMQ